MKSSWLSDVSMSMATTMSNSYYEVRKHIEMDLRRELEVDIKSKYSARIIELEKENFTLQQRSPIGMAQQFVPGQIIPNINVNDWYYNQNTMMYEQRAMCAPAPKKKDIKSLIAYYYNR